MIENTLDTDMNEHQHDYDNPVWEGRAKAVCKDCGFDSFENHAAAAIGYSPYAFVSSKEDAEKICSEEIENPSWTNQKIVRKYTYREIFKFSEPKNLGELNESK